MRNLIGIRLLGEEIRRNPKSCQRCEERNPWIVTDPPLLTCCKCILQMPDEEFEWLTDIWERNGLVRKLRWL